MEQSGVRTSRRPVFYPGERSQNGPFCWTRRKATLRIPVSADASPRRIILTYIGIHPDGSNVSIKVDGKTTFASHLTKPSGVIEAEIPPDALQDGFLDVEISATPFIPADLGRGNDRRELGIRLFGIRLAE